MPKKTRKEKLLAQTRRLPIARRQSSISVTHIPNASQFQTNKISYLAPRHSSPTLQTVSLDTEYLAIKYDLLKTILWSTIIIASELLLSRYVR